VYNRYTVGRKHYAVRLRAKALFRNARQIYVIWQYICVRMESTSEGDGGIRHERVLDQ